VFPLIEKNDRIFIKMDDTFEIPVTYKGDEQSFTAKILMLGYTHKIQVWVKDKEIFFEPDEERNYRALIDTTKLNTGKEIDIDLLKAIAESIESVVN
jgi:hypothetical protein